MQPNPLRQKLQREESALGLWVTLESPNITEAAAMLGVDWVVIEMEHGHLQWKHVLEHVRVANAAQTAALVRIPELARGYVQRALDIGADGIIVPMIETREQLEQAFKLGRFPPRGVRGVGGERSVKWGLDWQSYLDHANQDTMIIPLLETRGAVEQIDAILEVDGLEAVFLGPADMSASYGHLGQWEGPGVAEAILSIQRRAADRGIAAGILGRDVEDAKLRRSQGFHMIGLGADLNLMIRSLRQSLEAVR